MNMKHLPLSHYQKLEPPDSLLYDRNEIKENWLETCQKLIQASTTWAINFKLFNAFGNEFEKVRSYGWLLLKRSIKSEIINSINLRIGIIGIKRTRYQFRNL